MLDLSPGVLQNSPYLYFSDIGAGVATHPGYVGWNSYKQMNRLITKFLKRVRMFFSIYFGNLKMFLYQVFHQQEIFNKRADNPDTHKVGNKRRRAVRFQQIKVFFIIAGKLLYPCLDSGVGYKR